MHKANNRRTARNFFTPEEQLRIRQAVEQGERTTSGEIAVMIVDRSDRYRDAEIFGTILLAALCAAIICIASGHITIWSYLPLVIVLLFPSRGIFRRYPRLRMRFVNPWRIDEAVHERAIRGFYQKRLHRTRDETGILIFISLLERKVWILGDRGINSRIAPHFWHGLAAELALGLRQDRACDALCSVIAGCAKELERHFPSRPDDANELPDSVIL